MKKHQLRPSDYPDWPFFNTLRGFQSLIMVQPCIMRYGIGPPKIV